MTLDEWATAHGQVYVRTADVGVSEVETVDGRPTLRTTNIDDGYGVDRRLSLSTLGVGLRDDVWLSYSLFIPEGHDFGGGGKYAGLGGEPDDAHLGLDWGGNRDGDGWTVRFMFSGGGLVWVYSYITSPESANYPYGRVDTSNLRLRLGQWNAMLLHVAVNTADESDGLIEAWVNGRRIVRLTDVQFCPEATPANLILCHWGWGDVDTPPETGGQWSRYADFKLLATA